MEEWLCGGSGLPAANIFLLLKQVLLCGSVAGLLTQTDNVLVRYKLHYKDGGMDVWWVQAACYQYFLLLKQVLLCGSVVVWQGS